ncbi:unnamed protein product [Lymnaea stagnalis]|uniref:Deleted in malignant brain tumors 1 protein-like n=1 Tax=Lymnaea stagnalis TaxID=6523 RepID=A0AAV2HV28_LYMST
MPCGKVKVDWILTVFVLAWTSQCHGFKHNVTYLTLESGQPYAPGSPYSGRVVIQLDNEGVNGSICAASWTDADAGVVCTMLGFGTGKATGRPSPFAAGSRNYLMGNLNCTGVESSLSQCPGADHVISCVYGDDEVGVTCDGGPGSPVFGSPGFTFTTQTTESTSTVQPTLMYSICAGGSEFIRLLGREGTKSMGYVQVYVEEEGGWQFICDDAWSQHNAQVICSELFCHPKSTNICARPAAQTNYLPEVYDPVSVLSYGVQCNGTEMSIFDCHKQFDTSKTCTKAELAGVQCEENPLETEPTLDAVLDCTDPKGDLKIVFPGEAFPDLTEDKLNVVYKTSGSPSCDTSALTHRNDAELSLTIPHTDCGTRCTNNGTHLCYENAVEYHHQVAWFVLTESKRKEFTIQCCIPMESNVSIHFLPETPLVKNTLSQSYNHQPEINFCPDETCATPISASPYTVAVGDWVYVGINLKAELDDLFKDLSLEMAITNCTLDFVGALGQVESSSLIENKCPNDTASVSTYDISLTREAFRFKAFQRDGYTSAYVTCHVRVCSDQDLNSTCDRSCENPAAARHRRGVANDAGDLVKVVSSALIVVDAASKDSQRDVTDRRLNPRFFKP